LIHFYKRKMADSNKNFRCINQDVKLHHRCEIKLCSPAGRKVANVDVNTLNKTCNHCHLYKIKFFQYDPETETILAKVAVDKRINAVTVVDAGHKRRGHQRAGHKRPGHKRPPTGKYMDSTNKTKVGSIVFRFGKHIKMIAIQTSKAVMDSPANKALTEGTIIGNCQVRCLPEHAMFTESDIRQIFDKWKDSAPTLRFPQLPATGPSQSAAAGPGNTRGIAVKSGFNSQSAAAVPGNFKGIAVNPGFNSQSAAAGPGNTRGIAVKPGFNSQSAAVGPGNSQGIAVNPGFNSKIATAGPAYSKLNQHSNYVPQNSKYQSPSCKYSSYDSDKRDYGAPTFGNQSCDLLNNEQQYHSNYDNVHQYGSNYGGQVEESGLTPNYGASSTNSYMDRNNHLNQDFTGNSYSSPSYGFSSRNSCADRNDQPNYEYPRGRNYSSPNFRSSSTNSYVDGNYNSGPKDSYYNNSSFSGRGIKRSRGGSDSQFNVDGPVGGAAVGRFSNQGGPVSKRGKYGWY